MPKREKERQLSARSAGLPISKLNGVRLIGRSFWQRLSRDHWLIRYDGREKPTKDDAKRGKAYFSMIETGWGKASHQKLFADLFLGLSPSPGEIDYFMEMQRCSASQDVATAYFASDFMEREHGFEVAGQIRIPTLILHAKDDQIVPFQNSVDLAAEIPGARLKPLDGDCHWLLLKSARSEEYINTIEAFLRDE
ncbi:MAG: alpha/beta hydrolase [Gammaproteobacteria bacterium]|nr:MAG: alpha/beta hydrolase [Gammaproteobacteria bacterium]